MNFPLTEEDRKVLNLRVSSLRQLTGMPIIDCKKAAYMYTEDKDAVEYLQSHDWKMGKLF